MKIAEIYRGILLAAADNADNYPNIFEVESLQQAFGVIADLTQAIRDEREDYIDDYELMSKCYDKDYLLCLFDKINYAQGDNSYIDVILEQWKEA